jgi:hypothetical protein
LERIQEKVEVIRNGKPFTITAFTDVGKRFTEENKKQIKENLENSVDASKIDEKFSEKLKESSDLKGELSEDINLLLRKLDENPNVRDHADLIYSIQVKINNLEALNTELGDTLKENLKNRDLGKLEKFKNKISSIPKSLRNRLPTVLKRSTISQELPPPPTDTIPPAAEEVGPPLVETAAAAAAETAEAAAETAEIPLEPAKTPDGPQPLGIMPSGLALDKDAEHLKHCKDIDDSIPKERLAAEEVTPPASTLETSGKLDTPKVAEEKFKLLKKSSIEKSALAESYQVPKGSPIGAQEVSLAKKPDAAREPARVVSL